MIPSSPAKILIGISLDVDESIELLSWAIKILAQPGDTVVALHVIGGMLNKKTRKEDNMKKRQSGRNHFRQAKSFVISIMGELVKICQSNEVNLEARVGSNSSAGKGLIEEAKTMAADYLVVGSKRNKPNRSERNNSSSFIKSSNFMWKIITRITATTLTLLSNRPPPSTIPNYCCKNVPRGCSLVLVRRNKGPQSKESDGDESKSSRLWSKTTSFTSPKSHEDDYQEEVTVTSLMAAEVKAKQEMERPTSCKPTFKSISALFRMPSHLGFRKQAHDDDDSGSFEKQIRCFSYQEISTATNNFHKENLVGEGGYSEVYKGQFGNGISIAVKRLKDTNNGNNGNKEKEFLNELGVIGHVDHPNTAKLTGYCIENGLYLIFKFYPNGTLSSALHGPTSKPLEWPIRYRVILGIARGLQYLHKCCKHRIIHRDIKASNVLLGTDYEPQISDFGLAKWLPGKWSHHAVIPIEGTFGYLAPEYFMHGIVDEKIDVFAFGILILEILTGRRPVDSSRQNLLLWARPIMESGNLNELGDPKLEGRYDKDQLFRVALTASYCVRQSSVWRPCMTEVIELLTCGHDSEAKQIGWKIPKFTGDEMDDYSMIFGYQLPSDLALEDI